MQNHYKTLGLTNAASAEEIRRAYRVLARRYHPDVNPSNTGEEVFKAIAHAYSVLSDPERKKQYDLELQQASESLSETFDRANEALRRNQRRAAYMAQQREAEAARAMNRQAESPRAPPKPEPSPAVRSRKTGSALRTLVTAPQAVVRGLRKAITARSGKQSPAPHGQIGSLAILELSISIADAISGTRRTVEIPDTQKKPRKVSVTIPPGVRTGSIVRFKNKTASHEEIVVIIRVEHHPWLSLTERGLTMEIPLTVGEAIEGAKIQVPSLGEPLLVTVAPLTQSGKQVRLKNQGITNRDGTRGDLYIRFIVVVPDKTLPEEIRSVSEMLAETYSHPPRQHLPAHILEGQ
jgi:curved DNA-binding protein